MVDSYIFNDIGNPDPDTNTIISSTVFVYMAIAFLIFAIFNVCKFYDLFAVIRKPTKPIIAYKKAILKINSMDIRNKKIDVIFKGVGVNTRYEVVDKAISRAKGFHMYRDIKDAFGHEQSGDVVLEVMGYGKIQHYEKGYITSKQKVLQIIIDELNYNNNINSSNTFHYLVTNEWTDTKGNKIIFVPKTPYTYRERFKLITIPPIKLTELPYGNKNSKVLNK